MNQLARPNEPEIRTVCRGKITDWERFPSAIYRGQRVYFCTLACLRAFESDPDRFMAGEITHPVSDQE
jgi:YHS domain-containing protein